MLLHELNRNKKMKTWISLLILLPAQKLAAQAQEKILYPYTAKDSMVTVISTRYEPRSFLHKIIMGKNYRNTWSTPVKLPVLRLKGSEFIIEKLGGGQQTKSLRLKDKNGKEWALRKVDKDVGGAVPKSLTNTIVEKLVQDMISASLPYSHVIVANLSRAAGIIAPMPVMYFVADDAALGEHRSIFANTVCTLEEREPNHVNVEDTENILQKLTQGNEHLILQKKILSVRLMDMLVGDWDRHGGQLSWSVIDSGNTKYYYAIPRDRDNALFYSGGLLPRFARMTFMPYISGFKKNSSNIKKLSKKAWDLDGMFLNELDAFAWQQIITDFQRSISDEVIEASVKMLPAPVYEMDGKKIIEKIKGRREGLMKNAMKYYRFLSETVTINGSDEEDLFVASEKGDQLLVSVYQLKKDQPQLIIYERSFDRSETRLVYINGLKGNDRFMFNGTARSGIRINVNGNEGKDVYEAKGRIKTKILNKEEVDVVINNASSANFR